MSDDQYAVRVVEVLEVVPSILEVGVTGDSLQITETEVRPVET